eukprot:c18387_g1_i2 orf=111-485(+)
MMQSEVMVSQARHRPSSSGVAVLTPRTPPDAYGRHRKRAEILRLHEEIRSLEEELQVVEGYPHSSRACKELVEFTKARPDPLLSLNEGPGNPPWNRWFQQPDQGGGYDMFCCCSPMTCQVATDT